MVLSNVCSFVSDDDCLPSLVLSVCGELLVEFVYIAHLAGDQVVALDHSLQNLDLAGLGFAQSTIRGEMILLDISLVSKS